jgi:hypothetical protein
MARWISHELRQTIAGRATLLGEYCLIAEADTFYGCEVDHIISLKHGGSSKSDNLAYACALCNRSKGTDIGSISAAGEFTRFFNPRRDRWAEHFLLEQAVIRPLTNRRRSHRSHSGVQQQSALARARRDDSVW